MKIGKGWFSGLAAVAVMFLAASAVNADMLVSLSERSSDSTPASNLTAQLQFNLTGNLLTLTVDNQTANPHAFSMNEIYFNASSNVTGLALATPVEGWSVEFSQGTKDNSYKADGFGKFDVALTDGVGANGHQIAPGGTSTFQFTVTGTNLSDINFASELSDPVGSNPGYVAAGKFVMGPGDDSAFGASTSTSVTSVLPEPATMALMAFGLAPMFLKRMRRR
jgi:hypothetical protein